MTRAIIRVCGPIGEWSPGLRDRVVSALRRAARGVRDQARAQVSVEREKYGSHVELPPDTPRIGLEVRLVDGVPMIFTERGEVVDGQISVEVRSAVDAATVANLKVYLSRKKES